jgi:hypothetical protein
MKGDVMDLISVVLLLLHPQIICELVIKGRIVQGTVSVA